VKKTKINKKKKSLKHIKVKTDVKAGVYVGLILAAGMGNGRVGTPNT